MKTLTGLKIALAVAAGVGAFMLARKAGGVTVQAAQAVNPFNNDNVINRAVASVYQDMTGSTGTIGGDLYDFTHPEAAAGTNVINGAATSIYQKVTGSKSSIGSDLYDLVNPPKPLNPPRPAAPPVDNTVLDARDAMAKAGGFRSPTDAYYLTNPLATDHGMDFRFF